MYFSSCAYPEIFWAEGFHYRYYQDSANITFLPEYIFEKGKIKEHQKALKARVEKLARPAMKLSEWEKEMYVHDFICENIHYDKLKIIIVCHSQVYRISD